MIADFVPDRHWTAKLPPDLRSLVEDVEWACARARMHRADRRKKSRPTWQKAVRAFNAVRRACTAPKPSAREIRRLVAKAEKLFDFATNLARPPEELPPTAKQVTILDGYFATGDSDGFVFDRCAEPRVHFERWRRRPGHPDAELIEPGTGGRITACRVLPEALLPRGAADGFGRWRVTVEFWERSPRTKQGGRRTRSARTSC
ncbi:MAG TPA: hypothetical protein VHO06_20065 [Polyangia bacterium]|nr:hypothetical protein [Polyangia bacterium]